MLLYLTVGTLFGLVVAQRDVANKELSFLITILLWPFVLGALLFYRK